MGDTTEKRLTWRREWTPLFLARPIDPVAVSNFYKVGLLGVALTLLFLQLIYVGLVAAMAWLTYQYVLLMPGIFSVTRVNALSIPLVLAPVAAGAIATFFLLKPLLSRVPKEEDLYVLERDDEPVLFEFIDRLCGVVGSPSPRRIAIDLQVNASARLNRGWWSLIRGDLALTIGLPLVEGLTLRQFSGVLAHEFGHFSQKAGLRLHFLISTSRNWFARVAYERDHWDEQLEEWNASAGWRLKIVTGLANLTVKMSRAILRGLLNVGNRAGAWFSRQMEFDADRHEAGLIGQHVFYQTTHRLEELNHASRRAWQSVNQAWQLSKLPADVPLLIGEIDRKASGLDRASLSEALLQSETGQWDSHPSPKDRIANVEGLAGAVATTGDWGEDVPASVLFHNYSRICQHTTHQRYVRDLAGDLQKAELLSGPAFADDQTEHWRSQDSLRSLFGSSTFPGRWFRIGEAKELRVVLSETAADAEYWQLLDEWLNRHAGLHFLEAGGRIQPESFNLRNGEVTDARAAVAETWNRLQAEMNRLRETYSSVTGLLDITPELRDAYTCLSAEQDNLLELRAAVHDASILNANLHLLPAGSVVDTSISQLTGDITARLKQDPYLAAQLPATAHADASLLLSWADQISDRILARLNPHNL